MKKGIAFLLAMLLLISMLAGCAKTAEPSNTGKPAQTDATSAPADGDTTADPDPVTLSTWYFADPGVTGDYQAWADAVKAVYPWITIEFEELPYDSGPEKFKVSCATGTTPDMFFDTYSRIAPAVNGDLCVDLTDVVAENADRFLADPVDGINDGKNYYVPFQSGSTYGMAVNLTLAEKLGIADMLPEDKMQWSYDDFLNMCRAAKEADPSVIPIVMFAGSRSSDSWYYSLLMGNGVQLTNNDLTATAFNTGENREKAAETLNFFKTIIDEGLCPAGSATTIDEDTLQYWYAGNCLFRSGNAYTQAVGLYQKAIDAGESAAFAFDATYANPTGSGDHIPYSASLGTYGVCAFDNSDGAKTEAIKLAIGVMLRQPEIQSAICTTIGKPTLLNDVTVDFASEDLSDQMARGGAYSSEYARSDFGILEAWWTDFRETFYPQLQDFYVGKTDAETMLDNWQAAADAVIRAAATQ